MKEEIKKENQENKAREPIRQVGVDCVFLLDEKGSVKAFGNGCGLRDRPGEEPGGASFFELLAPMPRERCESLFESAMDSGRPVRFLSNGDGRLCLYSIHPLCGDSLGEFRAAVFRQDVTDRERAKMALRGSERRLRGLLKDSMVGVCLVQDNEVIYENPEHARFFGSKAAAGPQSYLQNVHPEDVRKLAPSMERLYAGSIRQLDADFRVFLPEGRGRFRWIQFRANWVRHGNGRALLANVMDITAAKELERMMFRDGRMGLLGRMVTGISHEIRNPLSLINVHLANLRQLCSAGLAEDDQGREEGERMLNEMAQASNAIRDVVKRIQDFSDPHVPRLSPAQVNDCVKDAFNLSREALRQKGIKVEVALEANLPPCPLDTQSVGQLLLNLIQNAVEALEDYPGERRILLKTFQTDGHVAVSVADSGAGIAKEIADKIFDPFFTTHPESSGVGLSIARRIAQDHGGRLLMADSLLGGAEFCFLLPVCTSEE